MANYTSLNMSSSTLAVGTQTSFTINNNNESYGYSEDYAGKSAYGNHNIVVKCTTTNTTITWSKSGSTYRFTVAGSALPNTTSGKVSVTIPVFFVSKEYPKTPDYSGPKTGDFIKNETFTYTINVPNTSTYKPSGTIALSRVNVDLTTTAFNWGLYVQNHTKTKIAVSGLTPGNGATVSNVHISANYNALGTYTHSGSTSFDWTSNLLSQNGNCTFTIIVIDSRGRQTTYTREISVYGYAPPKLSGYSVYRCTSGGTRDDINGTYAKISATFTISPVDSNNGYTTRAIAIYDGATKVAEKTSAVSGTAYTLGGGNLSIDKSYKVIITITDTVGQTTSRTITLPSAMYLLHFKSGGQSIGIARASGSTNDRLIHVGWSVDVDSDKRISVNGRSGSFRINSDVLDGNGDPYALQLCFSTSTTDTSSSGIVRGIWDVNNSAWMIYSSKDKFVRFGMPLKVSNISTTAANGGVLFIENDGTTQVGGIWHNTSNNIWIGAMSSSGTHLSGNVYISSGWDASNNKGFDSIYVWIPSSKNSNGTDANGTAYQVYHKGMIVSVANGGTGRSTLASGAVLIGNGTSGVNTRAITDTGTVTANTNLITANALTGYAVHKTGDTMTGTLSMSNAPIHLYTKDDGTGNNDRIWLHATNGNYIFFCRDNTNDNRTGFMYCGNNGQIQFYGYPAGNTTASSTNREAFRLPAPTDGRTAQATFDILTTKDYDIGFLSMKHGRVSVTSGSSSAHVEIKGSHVLIAYYRSSGENGLVSCWDSGTNQFIQHIVKNGSAVSVDWKDGLVDISITSGTLYYYYLSDEMN